MPIKEFECEACKHRFEDIFGINDPPPTACPKCGKGPLKQILGTFRIGGASKKSSDDNIGNDMDEGADFGDPGNEGFGSEMDAGLDEGDSSGDEGLDTGDDTGGGGAYEPRAGGDDSTKDEEV